MALLVIFALLAVIVFGGPIWRWFRGSEPAVLGPPVTLTFRVTSTADPQALERARRVLESRARALGLGHPSAAVRDDRTIVLDTTQPEDDATLAALWAPGRLEVRKVVRTFPMGLEKPISSSPSPTESASTLDGVIAKLGDAYPAALALTRPDGSDYERLRAFAGLTPTEVALLPATIQFNVPSISCDQLNARPATAPAPADEQMTICPLHIKMLLDRRALSGADVSDTRVMSSRFGYEVELELTGAGRSKLTSLSQAVSAGQGCESVDGHHCTMSILVDGRDIQSPEITAVISGLWIAVDGKGHAERLLAAQIGPRELPVDLELVS